MKRRDFNAALAAITAGATRVPAAAAAPDAGSGSITDVQGLKVGHFTETRRPTGCTVLLFEKGATAGVDVRGSAPGTRETDLLNPLNAVQKVQAILLSGGSACSHALRSPSTTELMGHTGLYLNIINSLSAETFPFNSSHLSIVSSLNNSTIL